MAGFDSHKVTKPQRVDSERLELVARNVVDCGYRLHRDIGPGLIESVYEILLCEYLTEKGLRFQRQLPVPIRHGETVIENAFAPTSSSKTFC